MKRTVGAMVLLAGLGGCVSPGQQQMGEFNKVTSGKRVSGVQGPWGQPVHMGSDGKAMMPYSQSGVVPAAARGQNGGVVQASGGGFVGGGIPNAPIAPHMGPAGAVAAIGQLPGYQPMAPINARSSVRFVDPVGMKVSWLGANGFDETVIDTPGRYNFVQGGIYRLKLTGLPTKPNSVFYPTLEVMPGTQKTAAYLAHSSVPVSFTEEDFEQAENGNFLVKVVYLPDPAYQDLASIAGPAVLTSRLDPGIDPIIEAQKRGTILLIIRMGNIDLQAPNTPEMTAPPGTVSSDVMIPGTMPMPGSMPPPAAVQASAKGKTVSVKPDVKGLFGLMSNKKK